MTDESGRPTPDERATADAAAETTVDAETASDAPAARDAETAGDAPAAGDAETAGDAPAARDPGPASDAETVESWAASGHAVVTELVSGVAEPEEGPAGNAAEPADDEADTAGAAAGDAATPGARPARRPTAWPGDSAIGGVASAAAPGIGRPEGAGLADPAQAGAAGDAGGAARVGGAADVDGETDPVPEPERASMFAPGGRVLPLRLARLHLRMGSLPLARAELESFAGGGLLDEPALVDLAEARWRTGDLAGAGDAANAAIARGVDDPLAFVIAAEAVAGLGRPAEARRLADRALETTGGSLDALFAGMSRSLIWPGEPAPDETAAAEAAAVAAAAAGRARIAEAGGPASAAAAEAFAGGRGALARGDTAAAALRLGVAIRLEPGFAQGVLAAIGDRASVPALALVAGDALRLLGREHEALAAYDTARGKARPAVAAGLEPEPAWPDGDAGLD